VAVDNNTTKETDFLSQEKKKNEMVGAVSRGGGVDTTSTSIANLFHSPCREINWNR
jgi:hypothetical protein